jgi:MFS family permease
LAGSAIKEATEKMGAQTFRNRWWVVFASVLGLLVGTGPIMVFAAGVFIKPLAQELGFGRGVVSSAISLSNLMAGLMTPFFGRLLDRHGFRPAMLPFIALFAVATASLSLINASLVLLMILFAFQGIVGGSQLPTGYSKMVTARFDRQRGLALGVALAGVGLGTMLIPQYARILLQQFGWRTGYIALGGAIFVLGFIPVAIFFGEPEEMKRAREVAAQQPTEATSALPGMLFSAAVRTPSYWGITVAVFLWLTAMNGTLMQLVPLLTDRGLSVSTATAALSASGLALIIGRIISGYLADKIFASYIAIFFIVLPMVGIAVLASGVAGSGPMIGTVLVGVAVGAEFDLMAFILSRYFGVRSFGALYGLLMLFVSIANAAGVVLMGWCYQVKHSYVPMFMVFEVMLVVAIILMARLGAYRYPAPGQRPKVVGTVGAAG